MSLFNLDRFRFERRRSGAGQEAGPPGARGQAAPSAGDGGGEERGAGEDGGGGPGSPASGGAQGAGECGQSAAAVPPRGCGGCFITLFVFGSGLRIRRCKRGQCVG